jgi:hypothetical protein
VARTDQHQGGGGIREGELRAGGAHPHVEEGGGAGLRRTDLAGFDGQLVGAAEEAASSLLPSATDAPLARPRDGSAVDAVGEKPQLTGEPA